MVELNPAGWSVTASADNGMATAAKAAAAGKKHIVFGVSADYSAAVVGKLLQIKDGTNVIWQTYVHNSFQATFPRGLAATTGNAVSAELAASGTGGTVGVVSLHGVTV